MIVITLARKPCADTVAACTLERGTGGLNIDDARIPLNGDSVPSHLNGVMSGRSLKKRPSRYQPGDWKLDPERVLGRWPANLVLNEESSEEINRQGVEMNIPPAGSSKTPDYEASKPFKATSYSYGGVAVGLGTQVDLPDSSRW